jgi:putative transposase
MIGYLDWKSFHLAGYEIMLEENTQCIASALRNSILNLGKAPQFNYLDNGKAFRGKYFTNSPSFEEAGFAGLFGRFNIIPVFAMPYNARAKVIEPWWKIFSNSFERLLPSYIGASIDDKPAYMMRNEKFHRALRGDFTPTIWEAVEMIDQWLDLWSSRTECPHVKGQTVKQVFEAGKGPGLDVAELDDLMMSAKITKVYQNGIRIWGEYYWHESLYGKKWEEVIVRYSIFDKSNVRVYGRTGALLCTATKTADMNPLVNYLGTEAEKERFKNVIEMRGRMRKSTIERSKEILEAPMPIAVNAGTIAGPPPIQRTEGVRPGMLMLNQAVEQTRNIDTLKTGIDLAQIQPEEPEQRPRIALFECDLDENS